MSIKIFTFLLVFISVHWVLSAQESNNKSGNQPDYVDLSNMSLEELTKMKSLYHSTEMEKAISQAIVVASRNPTTMRNSASVVSIITEDEIVRSGAKDLMEILYTVPGLDFNVDVTGVVGLSVRGLWANEGDVLLLWDGQEMNETAYGCLSFGNHYPVSQIKKIEVIRGPGSAIYGGYAGYAVINIITKKGDDIKGLKVEGIAAQTDNSYVARDAGFSIGNSTKNVMYSVTGFFGQGQRSDQNYTDVYGKSVSLNNNSRQNPNMIHASLNYKNLSFCFIYDNFLQDTRDGYIPALSQGYPCNFLSYLGEVKYSKQISKKFKGIARFDFKENVPWTFDGNPQPQDSSYGYYKIIAKRYRFNLSCLYDPLYWLNMNIGFESYEDVANKPNGQLFVADSTDHITYYNFAGYGQISIKSRIANLTLGARYDVNNAYGSSLNPRLGITKKVNQFNFKLLYASSFRAPAIEDIQYGLPGVKIMPEKSTTAELECGYKVGRDMFVSLNLFDITTHNAIRYFVRDTVSDPDGYRNTNKTIGSRGFEMEYKYVSDFGILKAGYSLYTVAGKGVDSANLVSIDNTASLGVPRQKLSLMLSVNTSKNFFVTASLRFEDKRYGYTALIGNNVGVLTTFAPQTFLNLYFGNRKPIKNLNFGLGVDDITNEKTYFLQAYNSFHAPLPGMGRQYIVKLNYTVPYTHKS